MGRLSELFWYINADKVPSENDMRNRYAYIEKSGALTTIRNEVRKSIKKADKTKKE